MGQSTARHAIIAPSAYDTTPAMLDPSLLRQDPAALAERLRATRGFDLDAAAVEPLEAARNRTQVRTPEVQKLRNTRLKQPGQAQAQGEAGPAQLDAVARLSAADKLAGGDASGPPAQRAPSPA